MLVMTRFSMRSRTATHSLATLSIIACICSAPTSCLLAFIVYAIIGLSRGARDLSKGNPNPGRGPVGDLCLILHEFGKRDLPRKAPVPVRRHVLLHSRLPSPNSS